MSTLLDLHPAADTAAAGHDGDAGHDMLAVRAWARSRGYPIDETSGVPLVVLRTYRRLHGA